MYVTCPNSRVNKDYSSTALGIKVVSHPSSALFQLLFGYLFGLGCREFRCWVQDLCFLLCSRRAQQSSFFLLCIWLHCPICHCCSPVCLVCSNVYVGGSCQSYTHMTARTQGFWTEHYLMWWSICQNEWLRNISVFGLVSSTLSVFTFQISFY